MPVLLDEQNGDTPAAGFGPLELGAVQTAMVEDLLSVNTINARVRKVRFVWRWLAAQGRR